jgi:hypothetical protein
MMNVQIRPEISQFEIDLKTGKSLSGEPRALYAVLSMCKDVRSCHRQVVRDGRHGS